MEEIKAINDNVLVRVQPPELKTVGGIVLTREESDLQYVGEVVAVGPGRVNVAGVLEPTQAKKGDRVLFQQLPRGVPYDTVVWGNEEFLVIRDRQVLAVFERA